MGDDGRVSVRQPSGTVTLLFTDIESSMVLWGADADSMAASLEAHDSLLNDEMGASGGYVFTRAGDSFAVAFADPGTAVAAAQRCQRRLAGLIWPGPALRVRMGLHRGEVQLRDGDYFGPTVNLASRIADAGHGGQIVASGEVVAAAGTLGTTMSLGTHTVRGSSEALELHQIGVGDFPSLRTEPGTSEALRFDEFEIDLAARVLRADREVVAIEPQVLDVLIHLVVHRDRLVSREELLDEVWGDQFVSLSALTTRIKQARQALGDDGRAQRYIRNERGRGYQFVGDLAAAAATEMQPAPAVTQPTGPRRRPDIVGREDDLRTVHELLSSSPLTTVVGPGGVGKTTLLTALLADWASVGRGAVLVRLDQVRSAEALLPAVMTALGLAGGADVAAADSCADWLAGTDSTLVLDNCEHVVDEVRGFVTALHEAEPGLTVLASSRQPLGLGSESVHRLRPFQVPTAPTAADVSTWPCLELFEIAMRRAGGTGISGDEEWAEVADLCRRLDGLPLAIELAAGRLGTLDLRDLVEGLDDRLDWFRDRRVDTGERQRSLRSTVDWSFRFLDDECAPLVAVLALFPAGLRLADVRTLTDALDSDTPADELVARLVDSSVIVRRRPSGEARYTMLETIRQFALEGLDDDAELRALADQLLVDHALRVADRERDQWLGVLDPRDRSVHRLRDEVPNLRAARELLIGAGDLPSIVRLSAGLVAFTEEATLSELWSWHDVAVDDGAHPDLRAAALLLEASAARNRGDIGRAREAGAAAAQLTDDRWVRGRANHTAAMAALFSGEPALAGELWLRSDEDIGGCRGRLFAAMAAAFGGDLDLAAARLAGCEIEPGSRVPSDLFTNVHLVRGEVARVADTGTAKAEFEQAVQVAREEGLLFSLGIAQVPLVAILQDEGDVAAAAAGYQELVELFLRAGTWTQVWITLRNAAQLLRDVDPGTALLICAVSARDPSAPALDDAAQAEVDELRAMARDLLGDEEVDRIERRATLASRVEVVREAGASLRALG